MSESKESSTLNTNNKISSFSAITEITKFHLNSPHIIKEKYFVKNTINIPINITGNYAITVPPINISNYDLFLHGVMLKYNEQGINIEKSNYTEGVLNGECIKYSHTGVLESITYFLNGILHGEASYYNADGSLRIKTLYTNGVKN